MTGAQKLTPDAAFERDVPAELQEDVMQRICESTLGDEIEGVSVIDEVKHNALDIEVSGGVMIDGREFWFHVRNSDTAGTELMGWEESGAGISHEPREALALCPSPGAVFAAVADGTAASFLDRWDRDLDPHDQRGCEIAGLPGKAAYDAFFAPGTGAARTHHDRAAAFGYTIEEASAAQKHRRHLLDAALHLAPTMTRVRNSDEPAGLLEEWREVEKRSGPLGEELDALRAAAVDRLSKTLGRTPSADENRAFRDLGYQLRDAGTARRARRALIRPLLTAETVDGFDPADLPEDPVAALFRTLDPALVRDTRVRPESEVPLLLDVLADRMARENLDDVPDRAADQASRLGVSLTFNAREEPAPDGLDGP